MRSARDMARVGLWGALLLGLAAAAVPLAAGVWDPEVLRVARPPVQENSSESKVEVPDVPARFTAHGPAGPGVTWTLSGDRVVGVDPPLVHALTAPRLTVCRGEEVLVELSAARGEVRLPRPRDDGDPPSSPDDAAVRLHLDGGVLVVHGDVTATTEQVSVWLHRSQRFDPETGGARLTAPRPIEVRAGTTGRRLTAAGLEAVLVPLRVELVGPVEVEDPGDPLAAWPRSRPLRGRASRARLEGRLEAEPAEPRPDPRVAATPERLDLWLEEVRLGAPSPHADALACDALHLELRRAPAAARAALGGAAGLPPTPELQAGPVSYALERATARGRVRVRAALAQGAPDQALPDAGDVLLLADEVVAHGTSRRLVASGRPARVEAAHGAWVEGARLALAPTDDAGDGGRVVLVEGVGEPQAPDVRFGFAEPARATPTLPEAPPRGWRGAARRVAAWLRVSPAAAPPPTGSTGLSRLERLELEGAPGAPATLERDDGLTRLAASRARWDASGPRTSLLVEGEPATARLGSELTGEAPWRVRARRLQAWLDRDAVLAVEAERASPAGAHATLTSVLSAAEVEGQVEVAREGDDSPARHVALRGERLTWSRARQRLDLVGRAAAPAEVTVGEGTLRTPALGYDAATGRLEAAGPCALEVPGGAGRGAITVHAARASARLEPDLAAWREATQARRAARRGGARLVLPGWLEVLTLEGDAGGRVRASGPDGLSAAADRVTWDAATGLARLESVRDGPPARIALRGGALEAPRVLVWPARSPGRARALVVAEGGVRVQGRVPGAPADAAPLTLTCGWLSAEVWEPLRTRGEEADLAAPPRLPLGRVAAGGEDGVAVDGVVVGGAEGLVPVRLRAARVEGDGVAETLRLVGRPDDPVLLARGDLALKAPEARLGLEDDGKALRVAVDGPWSCGLPAIDGQTGGRATGSGPLELLLDAPATDGAPAPSRDPAALARRVLALDASGGLEVVTPSLRARADRVRLARPGELVLTGDPVEVTRGAMRSRGLEQVLRLEELTGRGR